MITPDLTAHLPETLHSAHFVGIGGSGMSGIARVFAERGIRVTGSDRSESATTRSLRELGIEVQIGHEPIAVRDADAVVVTGALWEDNPEYRWAIDHGIPVVHRSVALDWLTTGSRLVAIAGAHGKTTSTAMVVTGIGELGGHPSFVNGGVIEGYGVSARRGSDAEFVIEADESDGSFLLYDVSVGLVTNVDTDHLDNYGSTSAFDDAFVQFINGCSEVCVVSADDPTLTRLRDRMRTTLITFGESPEADFCVSNIESNGSGVSGTITHGAESHLLRLAIPGRHNAINATGAVAVLVALGHDFGRAVASLSHFEGTGRRFQLRGESRGVRVFDDYAHHPVEVRAALATARSVVGEGKVIAIHQPHLYSRTQAMAREFAAEYEKGADFTVVLDVHGAREDPIPGVTGALVSQAFGDPNRVEYCPDWDDAARSAAQHARTGDIIMTLSCGDVYRIIPRVLTELEQS